MLAMSTIEEQATAYESSRQRIEALARSLNADQLSTVVPSCPLWTVGDVVGHLTGVWEDRRDGRMPSGTFSQWTAEQVVRHRDESLASVLNTWNVLGAETTEVSSSLASLTFDVVTHEHDLYQVLKVAGNRDTDSVRVGAERARGRMSSMLTGGAAPGVLATTEDGTNPCEGVGSPIKLETSRYSLKRLTT